MAQTPAAAASLEVSISAGEGRVVAPFSLRVTLHFHNNAKRTLWLYRPVAGAGTVNGNPGGSSLAVHLEPAAAQSETPDTGVQHGPASPLSNPAMGTVLRISGFPHPQLMALEPGGNATENVVIHAVPSVLKSPAGSMPLWGAYTMFLVYSASYPDGAELRRSLGVDLWSGSVSSNAVEVTLQPPAVAAGGVVSGKVVNHEGQAEAGILVSLTDNQEHLITQSVTGFDGGFRFGHLPFGRYWVTVRRLGADQDTSFFEHTDLSSAQPDAPLKLIMLNQEVYEAKQVLHKPVLFSIRDGAGNPVADAQIKLLWSNGPVLENAKVETDENGLAVVDLIPGSNYATITKHHCPKVDQLANVAPGSGIDGFSITYNCEK